MKHQNAGASVLVKRVADRDNIKYETRITQFQLVCVAL